MFWIALAAQLTAPIPQNVERWFTADDVPDYLVREGTGLWAVPIRMNVTPDGTVQGCDLEATSRIADLDKLTCRILLKRARFQPARSADGLPSYGVYRTAVKWTVADDPWDTSKVSVPDIDITVQRLPKELNSPTLVRVAFAVDPVGGKSSCTAFDAKGLERVVNHPALVAIACRQVLAAYPATPARDASRRPVSSVQNALVRFSVPLSK
jgi:hypothetical protein